VVRAGRLQAHLVERPRVLEVGDERLAERGGGARAGPRRLVGDARREHEVRVAGDLQPDPLGLRDPPAGPWRGPLPDAVDLRRQAGAARRLRAGEPVDLRRVGDPVQQSGILGIPAVGVLRRAGDDRHLVPVRGEVADGSDATVHACAADRREVTSEHQDPRHGHDARPRKPADTCALV
jgi:hypothetical protein